MRVVVQRVARAAVRRPGAADATGIGPGALLLVGFGAGDDDATLAWMAEKILGLRIFPDADGALNRSIVEASGSLLAVPNFTLYGDARKGRRPSFTHAAPPEVARERFQAFVARLRQSPVPVAAGFFQEAMHVELVNDGPVTLLLEK